MGALGWLRASDSGDAKKVLERKLVVKLAYFFNYLDRQAFANAYVAGLREDIGLKGNEYSILLSIFTAGSVQCASVSWHSS
ncbi:uncharacterized protein J4E79_003695 [Alternaria viburni]|uniref:uncharacterized protein n=1 Tax=Alternaria viburni TaxID=566460 RepID=UPI0020C1E993|nr:uncharacterized protein J4E79_003695 [Alternaria viburni]KAI4664193.1 hypothetical protein J4E79_003695 [Alternaria viburni]